LGLWGEQTKKRRGKRKNISPSGGGGRGEIEKKIIQKMKKEGPDLAKWRGWEWGWRGLWKEQTEARS
jgi:hypothetical protein